jgi:hypothetical protein
MEVLKAARVLRVAGEVMFRGGDDSISDAMRAHVVSLHERGSIFGSSSEVKNLHVKGISYIFLSHR